MAIDSAQLEQLFREDHSVLYAAAMAITRNRQMAEDAVHDALLAIAEMTGQPRDLRAYLFTAVRNKALLLTSRGRRQTGLGALEDFLDLSAVEPARQILLQQILQHIETMDSNPRQVLIMKLFADLTFEEIARVMNESGNTVASWYRRGLQQLQEQLRD